MRIWLTPEGQLSPSGDGYDSDSLTWRKQTPIIANSETVGMATLDRTIRDGQSWIVADAVFDDGYEHAGGLSLDVEPALERFEVVEGKAGHWVESGVLRRLVVDESLSADADQVNQLIAEAERALVAAADNDEPTGIAVVLTVSLESAEAIRHAEGLDVSELHATLGFFGSVDETDESLRENLLTWAEATAVLYSPVTATVSGRAAMGFDDPQAVALLVENEAMESMRSGIDDDERADAMSRLHPHFTPHVTIGYGVDFDEVVAEGEVTFDQIAVWWGADREAFPLSGDLTAAAFQTEDEDEDDETDEMEAGGTPVEGVIAIEGEETGDGRMIEPGALTWDTLPVAIVWDRVEGDHSGMVVGLIESIERRDNGEIWAVGRLSDSEDEETQAAVTRVAELLDEGAVGVSVRLDSEDIEIRIPADQMEEVEEDEEDEPEPEVDEDGRTVVFRWSHDDELAVTTAGRVRHVAIVDTAAIVDGKLRLVASVSVPEQASGFLRRSAETEATAPDTIVAHAAAATHDFDPPPRQWFEMAEPAEDDERVVWVDDEGAPCASGEGRPWGIPLTVTPEGQIYGHLASWQDCHTGFPDRCLTPPPSASGYAWFHTGATETDDGQVPTGRITTDTSHASHRMNAAGAVAHYDQTGHAVADVSVVDGEMGPWMAGWVRPWATAQQRHELTAHPPSGDWRPRGGSTELIGVLAVNVPGFPMPRSIATYRAGELASLVASGLPPVHDVPETVTVASEWVERLARLEARVEADDVLRELESVG